MPLRPTVLLWARYTKTGHGGTRAWQPLGSAYRDVDLVRSREVPDPMDKRPGVRVFKASRHPEA